MDSPTASSSDRLAVIATLARRWPSHNLGRTKLVKCAYFLQTLRNVPLDYDFSLYSYGPYDSAVLRDLEYAKALNEVEVHLVHHSGGYGYDIRSRSNEAEDNQFVNKYSTDIDWVIEQFENYSPANMELASTIVFADRENRGLRVDTLAETVRKIKPHFSLDTVEDQITDLKARQLISTS